MNEKLKLIASALDWAERADAMREVAARLRAAGNMRDWRRCTTAAQWREQWAHEALARASAL